MFRAYCLVVACLVVGLVAGCGGTNSALVGSNGQGADSTGLANGVTLPAALQTDPALSSSGSKIVGPQLVLNAQPLYTTVSAGHVSWFRLPVFTSPKQFIVTLTQMVEQNTDLYVLGTPNAGSFGLLGSSTRTATRLDHQDYDDFSVPDWVYLSRPASTPASAGQVAVYHVPGGVATLNEFRIELDAVTDLAPDGATRHSTVPRHDSRWYRFKAVAGTYYVVLLTTVVDGDPDLFVYDGKSTGPVLMDDSGGGGSAAFTATKTGWRYVRVYGARSVNNSAFDLKVTTP